MESVASSSPPPDHRSHPRFKPTQPVADRIVRALRHRLHLLHRSEANFFVLGATGNVYTVNLSITPSCTCPDRTIPCKHILFVFLRVLGVSLDDSCLRRRTLRPCQLTRLLGLPSSPEALAGGRVRERFHELFAQRKHRPPQPSVGIQNGATCPICLEEMGGEARVVVTCETCRNSLHKDCLLTWKMTRGRRSMSCVLCRARWRERVDRDRYLNLAAYVSEDDMIEGGRGLCGG